MNVQLVRGPSVDVNVAVLTETKAHERRAALQPLSAINSVLDRLGRGDVPSRVVLDFSRH